MVLKSLIEQGPFLPSLRMILPKAVEDAKPLFSNGFLFATDPQKIPDVIDCLPVRHQRMTWLWQVWADAF